MVTIPPIEMVKFGLVPVPVVVLPSCPRWELLGTAKYAADGSAEVPFADVVSDEFRVNYVSI